MSDDEIGEAAKMLEDTVRLNSGLGVYIMVIQRKGKTESFKSAFKEIDGSHFYQHLFEAITDDFRDDVDPTHTVMSLPSDILRQLFEGSELEEPINKWTAIKERRTTTHGDGFFPAKATQKENEQPR